jgi:hypothetical protein
LSSWVVSFRQTSTNIQASQAFVSQVEFFEQDYPRKGIPFLADQQSPGVFVELA